ncbi:MAG: DUF1134 domain-containing protein [Hyphomicrobiaceae bacterium]|nr:DUF1134 domain-containing protein [Hyphomicrobiaceae bacterium]
MPLLAVPAVAQTTCSREEIAAAVDGAGAALRAFNSEMAPRIQDKLKALQKAKGWSNEDAEERAVRYLYDNDIAAMDAEANALLTRIDALGEVPEGAEPNCAGLSELEKAGRDLLGVMKRKSAHTLAKLDRALAGSDVAAARPDADETRRREADGGTAKRAAGDATQQGATTRPKPSPPSGNWGAVTRETPGAGGRPSAESARAPATAPAEIPPLNDAYQPPSAAGAAVEPAGDTYTIDEIREVSRGFFGNISTNLASVIEYAFSSYGRPAGYVLGSEGGGAFLAGVRYGKGELFTRAGDRRRIYWHGPSIGYDFGAEGSRTLFLVYKLTAPEDLYRRFAGVDGSAYLVGGVGVTLLKGGPILMAPIRTGLGLRLGANIGYVKFTPNATWNPF